jgi:DNA-binding NtrC family response regulator
MAAAENAMKQKILLIEDDNGSRLGIVRSLSQRGYAVSVACNLVNAEEDVLARRFDAVILGINCTDGKGPAFIQGIRVYDPSLPIVVITGGGDIEIAVDAVRCGADNVLAKPVDFAALCAALKDLLEDDSRKLAPATAKRPKNRPEENFFGTGPAARLFLASATRAASEQAPVLITGETGTGKGLLARWIHENGSRPAGPFAGVNCSGLRGDLLKAEIFGPAPGTGPGSTWSTPGLLERAQGGTLFLDEIGDMDLTVQAGLLAALQAGRQHSTGEGAGTRSGFHLICTSNQQLDALARAGSFLPKLLDYISATSLRIPPLRERLTELPGIVRHLLDGLRGPEAQITDEAMRALKGYRWPGNLRELKNALEQGLILSQGARLRPEHFDWLRPTCRIKEPRPLLTMSELKEQHIAAVLQRASGDVGEVAHSLGISRATMYRRLKQLRGKEY